MAVAVAMVLCTAGSAPAGITVVCNGSECGGSGPRDYFYEVTTTEEYDGFVFNAGTADRDTGNYSNPLAATLVGGNWVAMTDGPSPGGDYDICFGYGEQLDIHSPMTVHGGGPVTPNGKSNMVIAWFVNGPLPANTYGFGYDNDTDPLDVSWFFDEGSIPFPFASSDWSKVVGTGLGPVHGPSPEPATLSLLAVGIATVMLKKRRK